MSAARPDRRQPRRTRSGRARGTRSASSTSGRTSARRSCGCRTSAAGPRSSTERTSSAARPSSGRQAACRDLRRAGGARRRRPGPARPRAAPRPRLLHRRDRRGLRPRARPRARRRRPLRRADGPLRPAAAGGRIRALPRAHAHRPGGGGASRGLEPSPPGRAREAGGCQRRPHPARRRSAETGGAARGPVRGHARHARRDRGRRRRGPRGDSRSLVFDGGELVLVTMRPSDVPTYVEAGAADLGITGKDVLLEQRDRAVYELLDLGYGACRMVLAGRRGDERLAESERRLGAMRIATKYPRTAERYFEETGRQAEVIEVKGSVELAPLVGLADGIVDLVDTGRTLAENDLEVREEIARCTARLVANRVAHKLRAPRVDALAEPDPRGDRGMRIERRSWDGRGGPSRQARGAPGGRRGRPRDRGRRRADPRPGPCRRRRGATRAHRPLRRDRCEPGELELRVDPADDRAAREARLDPALLAALEVASREHPRRRPGRARGRRRRRGPTRPGPGVRDRGRARRARRASTRPAAGPPTPRRS